MQDETFSGLNQLIKPHTILAAKPTSYHSNQKQIYIALANFSLSIADTQKLSFSTFSQNLHEKRINCVKQKNNIIFTGSNDFTVRLWDRSSGKCIQKLQKPGAQFNCLDISQNIITAAHTSKLTFWDLRKMKQRAEFNDSFNGQITSILFDPLIPTNLMGCSVDGMINKFDLTEPDQQQAFMWCTKIMQCPSKLQFINDHSLVQTTNHTLYLLEEQAVKNKIVVNNLEEPKHILNSKLSFKNNEYSVEYFTWNLEKQLVEKYKNDQIVGYLTNVEDSEVFIPLNKKRVLYVSQKGEVFIKDIQKFHQKNQQTEEIVKQQKSNKFSKNEQKWQKIQEEYPVNQNGFILNKPSSFKEKTKKFKPF